MKTIAAKQAKVLGFLKYFTGKPCKNSHVAERNVINRQCVECAKEISKSWVNQNRQRYNEIQKKFYSNNKDEVKAKNTIWREKNKDKFLQMLKNYKSINKEKYDSYNREYWSKRNAAKLQRTPLWLTQNDQWMIKEIYELALLRSKVTGIKWEVDHIIPLQGKMVSGLHVPLNLQVISATENRSKSNKF
jgi:hypothetical protein